MSDRIGLHSAGAHPAAFGLLAAAFPALWLTPLLSPVLAVAGGIVTVVTSRRRAATAVGLALMTAALVAFVALLPATDAVAIR